jgi:hypothetical protein
MLVDAGLSNVNISLDTLVKEKFEVISRRDRRGHLRVLASVHGAVAKHEQYLGTIYLSIYQCIYESNISIII